VGIDMACGGWKWMKESKRQDLPPKLKARTDPEALVNEKLNVYASQHICIISFDICFEQYFSTVTCVGTV
jgi:hypothetical protein